MRNCMTFFLNRKIVMQNRLHLYLNRTIVMRNSTTLFLIWKMIMKNFISFFLIIKRIMRNNMAGISVGAYCIRLIKTAQKETYDQKYRYMWGVFNTPLSWRTKRSIPKINFGVMWNGITFFLIRKIVMQNRLSLYLDRKRIRRKGKTIFLIWKMVMQNRLYLYLNRKMVIRNGRKGFREHVFKRCFWGTYFEGVFFFVTKRKHSGFVVKSGVQNGESLFEKVYSSSPSRMDVLSENKQ